MNERFGFEKAMSDDAAADAELAEIQKGLGQPGGPPEPPAPPAPQPPTPPAPPAPQVKKEELGTAIDTNQVISTLQAALEIKTREASTSSGRLRVQAEEIRILKEQNQALTDKLAGMEKKPESPAAPTGHLKNLQDDLGLDEASASRFNTMLNEQVQTGVQAVLDKLGIKPGHKAPEPPPPPKEEQPNLSDASWNVFNSMVTDFAAIANVVDGVAQFSPELKSFFNQRDSKTGLTHGQLAYNATKDDDPVRLAAIYNEFKAVMARAGRPIRPVAPNTSKAGGNISTGDKPKYSRKDADAFEKKYQKEAGSYTPDQLQEANKIMAEYEQAALEGRLID